MRAGSAIRVSLTLAVVYKDQGYSIRSTTHYMLWSELLSSLLATIVR